MLTKHLAREVVCAAILLLVIQGVSAQEQDGGVEALRERVERLEKQNQDLLKLLSPTGSSTAVPAASKPVAILGPVLDVPVPEANEISGISTINFLEALPAEEKKDTKAEAKTDASKPAAKEWVVSQNLGLTGIWTGNQYWLESPDKAFRLHIGARTQFDAIWANATQRVQNGVGGTGHFNDGVNFRRGRLQLDGWFWETCDFMAEYDFFQTVNDDPTMRANEATNVINSPCPTDLWGSINYIPYLGTVRIGNMKPAIMLEHLISSRYLDFLERAAMFDIYFNRNNGFQPGISVLNWTEDERMTWSLGFFKNNNTIMGWNSGDGEYQVDARVTWLPWYEDNGRRMIHLGLGGQWDAPDNHTAILLNRWLLRNGPPTTQNRVGQAIISGHDQVIVVPEFFMNLGPLSIQAEYLANHLNDVSAFQTQSQGAVALKSPKGFFSQSFYVQALYFLTGEHRPYNSTALHNNGAAPTRVIPFRNFFWVPGQNCGHIFSQGAWQVGVRYCYSDLSNNGIYGGQTNEVTLGLNWFLNPNMKIQWNYDIGYRGQLGPLASSNGTYQGFGTRFAIDW